ncbi:histidine phosphatase family protein [bacterium]|nr:histidine phosphatase family protein [bacterium]MBU1957025.1 histidine phosphatase family protein [bacterium]
MFDYPTIILLRHGQTEWNVEGRYQGQLNSALTLKGKEQAKVNALKLHKHLGLKREFKFFSSPLGRAKESAFIICETLGLSKDTIIFDERIQEFNYGIFEGKTKEECARVYADELRAREADKFFYTIEGGESYERVNKRLYSWLESVKDEKLIIMVAHEMVNRALRGIYSNYSNEKTLTLRQENDLVIKLENRSESIVN